MPSALWPGTVLLCVGALRLKDAMESFMIVDDRPMLAVSWEDREAMVLKD